MMNFQKEVLDASYEQPVLVDFWAEWCGPCRVLGPVLELLEKEFSSWKLLKVNVDAEHELSAQFQIRGIPAVKLFYQGNAVAEFTGALPAHQIRQWLHQHLPDKRKEALHELLEKQEAGEDIQQALQDLCACFPEWLPSKIALARFLVWQEPEEAVAQLSGVLMGSPEYQEAEHIRHLAALITFKTESEDQALMELSRASQALGRNQKENAIEALIRSLFADKHAANDLARKAGIALFTLEGAESELAKQYRRRFDMALF